MGSSENVAKMIVLFALIIKITQCQENLENQYIAQFIQPELVDAMRCFMRVWLRRELVQYADVSSDFKARVDDSLNTCTPELLFAADLPQDFYVAGDDLV